MKISRSAIQWSLTLATLSAVSNSAFSAEVEKPAAAPAGIIWLNDLEAAQNAARKNNQPIVVLVDAPWCMWCRELEKDLTDPKVQEALKKFICVQLNFDRSREAAKQLGVVSVPAMRTMRSTGRAISAQDGVVSVEKLIAFLSDAAKDAATPTPEALLAEGAPDENQLKSLIAIMGDREPAVREAAIRRLIPFPAETAKSVVDLFGKGTLAARLSSLDVLEAWGAPTAGLDPWRRETITKEKLDAISAWSANPIATTTAPALEAAQIAAAKEDLARLIAPGTSDSDTSAIRERMARLGKAARPLVYEMIAKTTDEQSRQRLTLLRYRLAASDTLALQWPTGLELLASPQVKIRHSALESLSQRVTARDTALLMELFSDSDALVRETALRLLQQVGGAGVSAIVDLLCDPDPNVRAAVLKTLTENPNPEIVPKVADYVVTETDADLIVHALRVFRASGTDRAVTTLMSFLKNDSWRIRAEAIEALTELMRNNTKRKTEFYAKLIEAMDDADGFVVSRALAAMEKDSALPPIESIQKAAEKHPGMVPQVIKIYSAMAAKDTGNGKKAMEYLRGFAQSKSIDIRTAAITGFGAITRADELPEAVEALRDPEVGVRIAALETLLTSIEGFFPDSRSTSISYGEAPELPPDIEEFLKQFNAGTGRPRWYASAADELKKIMASSDMPQRVRAAILVVAGEGSESARTVLKESFVAKPELLSDVARVLRWLSSKPRIEMAQVFIARAASPQDLITIARELHVSSDPSITDTLWEMLAHPKMNINATDYINDFLSESYLGRSYSEPSASARKKISEAAGKYHKTGNEYQKLVALLLLLRADPNAATTAAAEIAADPAAPEALRYDANQLQLGLLDPRKASAAAAKMIRGKDESLRNLGLEFMVTQYETLSRIRRSIYVSLPNRTYRDRLTAPTMPQAPEGLAVDDVKPLLDSPDAAKAARAGYLLAMLGDDSGMPKLMIYYTSGRQELEVQRMIYRAITVLGLDDQTPLLNDIYQMLRKEGSYEMQEFYWTIRAMKGDKVAALRKVMRAEVGMDSLR